MKVQRPTSEHQRYNNLDTKIHDLYLPVHCFKGHDMVLTY